MKLPKLPYDPSAVIEFFQDGLENLGAVCERSWHDRLHLIAEGPSARLWNPDGQLLETEIRFPPPQESGPRDAQAEVFPGCPLVFHLAEALRASPLVLQRAILNMADAGKAPASEVAEKLWHSQMPGASRWQLETPFQSAWHFSLLTLVRCEVQAIDQHWSLHRLVVSLPDGHRDESLASSLDFSELAQESPEPIVWPNPDMQKWPSLIEQVLAEELQPDLALIRQRQENFLRRELERIEEYYANYERELNERAQRQHREPLKLKAQERLAAARAEHERRRQDQVQRHEIRVIPHLDALVLLAEQAWTARVGFTCEGRPQSREGLFVARARRWIF